MAKQNDNEIIKKRFIWRIIGNWGVTFLGPLASTNFLGNILDIGFDFPQTIMISAMSATITVGLIFFNEIKEYGEAKL